MINPVERESLIKYRLDQAYDTIELADFLIKSGKLIVAVNCIYYGMFCALTALTLKDESTPKTNYLTPSHKNTKSHQFQYVDIQYYT